MLDVAVAYNRYKFLGEEFLTWLWFVIDTDQNLFQKIDPDFDSLEIGNRIVLENRRKEETERITIKGEGAGMEEAILALKKGALVTEIKLNYRSNQQEWKFTFKAESLNLSSLSTPKIDLPESSEDVEELVIQKMVLFEKILQFLEKVYIYYIKIRISSNWQKSVVPLVRQWINSQST
jgi:hypothetical protein